MLPYGLSEVPMLPVAALSTLLMMGPKSIRNIQGMHGVALAVRTLFFMQIIDVLIGALILPAPIVAPDVVADDFFERNGWDTVDLNETTHSIHVGILDKKYDDWLVFFNPNGVRYEQLLPYLEEYSKQMERNVVAFNFRGVGYSTGYVKSQYDMFDDGQTVLRYVLEDRKVQEHRILLHGWSLGAATALYSKVKHPNSCLIHDRSFTSISSLAKELLTEKSGFAVSLGAIIGAIFGMVFYPSFSYVSAAFAVGVLAGGSGSVAYLSGPLLEELNWTLDIMPYWNESKCRDDAKCIVVYHKEDGIIPYNVSLHSAMSVSPGKAQMIELKKQHEAAQDNHLYPLTKSEVDWKNVKEAVDRACGKDSVVEY